MSGNEELPVTGNVVDGYRWDGSAWVPVPGVVVNGYQWDGTEWVPVPGIIVDGYAWDGARWAPVPGGAADGHRQEGLHEVPLAPTTTTQAPPGPRRRRSARWILIGIALIVVPLGAVLTLVSHSWLAATPVPSEVAPTEEAPAALAIDAVRHKLYLTIRPDSAGLTPGVWVYDTPIGDDAREIHFAGRKPQALAVDERNGRLYVTHPGIGSPRQLSVVDTDWDEPVVRPLELPTFGEALALDPRAGLLYSVNVTDQTVYVLDLATEQVVDSFAGVGPEPVSLAVDPVAERLIVGDRGGSLTFVDTASRKVVKTIERRGDLRSVAVDPWTHLVYLYDASDLAVLVLDPETGLEDEIHTESLEAIAIDPVSRTLYGTSGRNDTLSLSLE